MRLFTKLAVLLTLFSIFSIAVAGYLAFENSRRALENETVNHLIFTNQSKEAQINRWIEDHSRIIEILAESPFFVDEFAEEMVLTDPLDPVHRKAHQNIIEKYLIPVINKSGFSELFILDAGDGRVLISTNSLQEGKSKELLPYFVHGKARTFVQNVYYSMSILQPVMTVASPLKGRDGKVIAVIAGRFDLVELTGVMAQRSPMKHTEDSYLVNTFNLFVTEPRFGKGYALKKSVHTEGVIAGLRKQNGVGFYANYQGVPVIGAYHWMPERELCLITEIEQAEAFKPIAALQKSLILAGVFVALIAALVGGYSARTVIRPLARLVKETEKISSGHLEYAIGVSGQDEVGDLSRSFAQMMARLKDTLVSRDKLAQEVAERERAETKLREKNAELEHFIYRISHDLKSPMVTADAFLEYLKKDIAAHDVVRIEKDVKHIQDALEKMGLMLNELLELSRIGRVVKVSVEISFQDLVGETLKLVAGHIARRQVDVRVSEVDMMLHGDVSRLVEIWQNLVENAIKYMGDQPHPCIEIGADLRGKDTAFFVRDNGMGIDPGSHARIFGLFEKLNPGSEGTGLGLALVKRIVEINGGRLWVESEGAGKGSCFWFTLPACERV